MTQEFIQTTNVLQDFREDTNKHVDKFKEWDLSIFSECSEAQTDK